MKVCNLYEWIEFALANPNTATLSRHDLLHVYLTIGDQMTWISYSWSLAMQVYSVDLLESVVHPTEILGSMVHPNVIKGSMGHPVYYTFHDPSYLQSAALLGLWYYK